MSFLRPRNAFLFGALAVLSGCSSAPATEAAPEPATGPQPDKISTELLAGNGTVFWNETIPVCWWQSPNLTGDRTMEKNVIQQAIERTWLRAAKITVNWTGNCPASGNEQFLAIELANNTLKENLGVDGQTGQLGMASLGVPNTYTDTFPAGQKPTIQTNPGIKIWVNQDGSEDIARLEYVAVHEFGHALGFQHEQDSPSAPSWCVSNTPDAPGTATQYGPWDPDSIMNYCADTVHGYLSEGDVMNIRAVYGLSTVSGNFAADVDGDGRADLIEVNRNGILVSRSTGASFSAPTVWAGGVFSGDHETLFADVDGDGKADAVAVNNGGIFVMLSDGTKFNWAGQWAGANTFGARKTLAADVNGDHKADVIAVNNTGINVLLSTGGSFGFPVSWSGSFYGTRETLVGDVNGDGMADIVADGAFPLDPDAGPPNRQLRVALSTGSSFSIQSTSTSYSANSRAAAVADVNGDGFADYVAQNVWGIDVALSNHVNTFNLGVFSSSGPFVGVHQSLLADVNGDHMLDAIAVNYGETDVELSGGTSFLPSQKWAGNLVAEPYFQTDTTGFFGAGDFGTLYSPIGDWSPASYKGECGQGQPVTGLSRFPGQTWDHAVHCAQSAIGPVQAGQCYARARPNWDNRGTTDNGWDWDPGNYKAECNANEYVAGVSQDDSSGVLNEILCCPTTVTHASCDVQVFVNGNSSAFSGDDWDPGYYKGMCPAGQYVAGVSSPANSSSGTIGGAHALLCCSP